MSGEATLDRILAASAGEVDDRKLARLREILEDGLDDQLASQVVDDPMAIRVLLVDQLRRRGSSRGVIQATEQFFMGVMRRAALLGLAPTPPEGPWTQMWQSVLDFDRQRGAKAAVRSLAAWATARRLDPRDIKEYELSVWARDAMVDAKTASALPSLLSRWARENVRQTIHIQAGPSDLVVRLRNRAKHGTTKPNGP